MVLLKVLGKKVLGKGTLFYPLPTNYVLGNATWFYQKYYVKK